MARKHDLMALTTPKLTAVNSGIGTAEQGPSPLMAGHLGGMSTRGPIGAVSRSIEQLKAHSVVEIDPNLIDASFITDRLDSADEHHGELVVSIRSHGQQVPVLVRPNPEREGRYQIVYGRRRLQAVRQLGTKVRAVVKPMTDVELVVAQGQENSARKDLTFIEKALFAARLEKAGYARETIMAALTVDKTALSRLISSAVRIAPDLIEAIGPAPMIGRDRWGTLADRLDKSGTLQRARALTTEASFRARTSDDRFNHLLAALALPKAKRAPSTRPLTASDGTKLGSFINDGKVLTVAINQRTSGDFAGYLLEVLPDLYASFKRGETGEGAQKPGK